MKRLFLLSLALLTFSIANSQIVNGHIGTGNITIAGTEWTNVYGIDFNNDGILEFRLSDFSGVDGNQVNAYISYNWTEGGNNVVSDPEIWDYAAVLASGQVVDANCTFGGHGDATFQDLTTVPERIFVGFRILLADGVHYGWAEAVVSTSASDIILNWVACAYNTTPNAPVTIGSTVAIANVETPTVHAYALGENRLRVETDGNEVMIYDIHGRQINSVHCNGAVTVNVQQSGLYLVRVGSSTRKVIVY